MTKAKITSLTAELSTIAKADAKAIQDIAEAAADQIAAILEKYEEVPMELNMPMLTQGRNAVSNIRMNFPKAMPMPPILAPMPPA